MAITPVPPAGSLAHLSPFTEAPTRRRHGILDRLLGRADEASAAHALAAALAGRDPRDVVPAEITAGLDAWGASGRQARQVLCAIWRQALGQFAADDALTDDEATQTGFLHCPGMVLASTCL